MLFNSLKALSEKMCARSKPSIEKGSSPSPNKANGTYVLEEQLQKLLVGQSHWQVHAKASLKLLSRRKLRLSGNVPPTPTPLPLPKVLHAKEDGKELVEELKDFNVSGQSSNNSFKRQISAPAAVKLTLAEACSQVAQKQAKEIEEVEPEERPPMMRRETRANLLQHASTCPGYGRPMIPSYWPEYVIDMFQNARLSEMPFVSFTESHWRLLCGSSQMPHPQKALTGGEDSLFVCPNGSAAGVADGVGEWQWRFGLDPRAFADELMNGAKTAGEQTQHQVGMKAAMRAQLMLSEGYQGASSFGSATALVAALDPSGEAKLGVANLGDSGLRILRWSDGTTPRKPRGVHIACRTTEQQHAFNCPFQLARLPEPKDYADLRTKGLGSLVRAMEKSAKTKQDLPEHSDSYTFEVQEGDVVLMGTDGIFDNLHDSEVCELAQISLEATVGSQEKAGPWHIDPSRLAKAYAEAARVRSEDTSARTPFGNLARQAGLQHMGGKMDDISVVVGVVVKV